MLFLKENQIEMSIKVLKVIQDASSIDTVKRFMNEYREVSESSISSEVYEYISKAVKKRKSPKKYKEFYENNKEFLHILIDRDLLYRFVSVFFYKTQNRDWFFDVLEQTDKTIIDNFITQMETLDLNEFIFTQSDLNIQSTIMVHKTIFSEEKSIYTILSDGDVFLFGKFYNDNYPYALRNAKYIYDVCDTRYGWNKLYINSFDVVLPTKEELDERIKIIPNLNEDELKARTGYIRYLFELEKLIKEVKYSIANLDNCQKLLTNYSIPKTNEYLAEVEANILGKIEETKKEASIYGFHDNLLELNLDYMRNCQSNLELDID